MNPLLLLGAAAVVVAIARSTPTRVSPPIRVGPIVEGPSKIKTRTIDVDCSSGRPAPPWRCGPGRKIPIPQPSDIVPESVVAAAGPILQAIEHGIKIVKQVFAALGWGRRCTVAGGEMIVVDLTPASSGAPPRFWMQVEGGFAGRPPHARWVFDDSTNDTATLPLTIEEAIAPTEGEGAIKGPEEQAHWIDGRKPPAAWHWPHGNIQKWQAYGGAEASSLARRPIAYVERSPAGGTLSLLLWLPPRAPQTHINAVGKQIVDRCVRWRIEWRIMT